MANPTRIRTCRPLLLTLLVAGVFGSLGPKSEAFNRHLTERPIDLRESVLPLSTNSILDTNDSQHWGTAFVIDREGTLITADHVISDLKALIASKQNQGETSFLVVTARQTNKLSFSGIPVTVVAEKPELDLAILRIPSTVIEQSRRPGESFFHFEPLSTDSRSEPIIGESVQIAGYPQLTPYLDAEMSEFRTQDIPGLVLSLHTDPIVTSAHIAGNRRLMSPRSEQTSWRINTKQTFMILDHECPPGNSGGPVISSATKHVVGVAVRSDTRGYCFAVKAVDLNGVLSNIKNVATAAP
jgi:S1-C subfamily serine protease